MSTFVKLPNGQPDETLVAIIKNLQTLITFVETAEAAGVGDIVGVAEGDGIVVTSPTTGTPTVYNAINFYNETGATLVKGSLFHISGFNTTAGITVTKADADANLPATHVLKGDVATLTAGVLFPFATVTGLNTGGKTIGDKVYLSNTAGEYVYAALTGADQTSQEVGVVKVVSAVAGEIYFFPGARQIKKIGTSWFQPLAVNTAALAAGAVTNAKIADSTGVSELMVKKSATVVYDFAVDGGTAGNIVLTGAPTIPDNAVVWLESYDVITTCTSATDAATLALGFPTDGVISTAVAISAGANAWDQGAFAMGAGATATPLAKKLTAARIPGLLVAGGENLTAGKIVFQLSYWVSA
jgi:hypothetical protein